MITGWFDSAQNWLSSLPGSPISDLVSGALLLVRRTLFPGTTAGQQAATAAAATGIATPVPNAATIAVTNWFSDTWNWLESANNPVATAVQDALVGVQRTLFSPAPIVKPVQYTAWTPGDPILGALQHIQPGGATVTIELTTAPTAGTVQLLSDGTYTYTPGADFTGTDTFTAAVTSGGINLLDPFTPRTANITVTILAQPSEASTSGYDIANRSGQPVVLKAIQYEPGYEDSVFSKPVGSYWQPGDYMHVELTSYAFLGYYTQFIFQACGDVDCSTQTAGKWKVNLHETISGDFTNDWRCEEGACENYVGRLNDGNWERYLRGPLPGILLVDPTGTLAAAAALPGKESASTRSPFPTAGRQAATTSAAAPAGIATPAHNAATIAVTDWFSDAWNWLDSANTPVATAVQDALVGVQRTLFSPAPTVKPVQYTAWTPGDPILGELQHIQPGGAAVSFQLTTAPTAGTVQLLSDGTYTYTPGPDFTGTDTFTASVTSGGINLLDPVTPRTAEITVTVNPTALTQETEGYNIYNDGGTAIFLKQIRTEPGYEDSVGSKPVGSIWQPGDYMHVELTVWAFSRYTTHFVLAETYSSETPWDVRIRQGDYFDDGSTEAVCVQGYCSNGRGEPIDSYRTTPLKQLQNGNTVFIHLLPWQGTSPTAV